MNTKELRDQLDQIARLDKDAIQSSPMSIPIEHLCDSNAVTAFKNALVSFYRSGALQRLAELAEDGKRYRWLKEQELKVGSLAVHCRVYDGYHFGVPGHKLDAAIDSARAPSVKEQKRG